MIGVVATPDEDTPCDNTLEQSKSNETHFEGLKDRYKSNSSV